MTDVEALLKSTKNKEQISARLLAPYLHQITIGLSVFLISIWSTLGFLMSLKMSLSGSTSLEFSTLTGWQVTFISLLSFIFGLFILTLDRAIVSNSNIGWSAAFRVIISFVLAIFVSNSYTVLLNEVTIKDFLKAEANKIYDEKSKEITEYSEELNSMRTEEIENNTTCKQIVNRINTLNNDLENEKKKGCAEKVNCVGPKTTDLENKIQNERDDYENQCKIRALSKQELDILNNLQNDLNRLNQEKVNPSIDVSKAMDAIYIMKIQRRDKLLKESNNTSPNTIDEFVIYVTYIPNMVFWVLFVIDLIALIVKYSLRRTSYDKKLNDVESQRERIYMHQESTENKNDRRGSWNPLCPKDDEKRWHI